MTVEIVGMLISEACQKWYSTLDILHSILPVSDPGPDYLTIPESLMYLKMEMIAALILPKNDELI